MSATGRGPGPRPRRRELDLEPSSNVSSRGAKVAVYVGITLVLVGFAFPLLFILNTSLKTQLSPTSPPSPRLILLDSS